MTLQKGQAKAVMGNEQIQSFQYSEGQHTCLAWKNSTTNMVLNQKMTFQLTNLHMVGRDAEERNLNFSLGPGQSEFCHFAPVVPAEGTKWSMAMSMRISV